MTEAKAAFLAQVEYRGSLRQMMEIGWVAHPIHARKRDVIMLDAEREAVAVAALDWSQPTRAIRTSNGWEEL